VAVEFLQSDKPNSQWRLLDYRPGDNPMVFQVFGNDPQKILRAAQRIEQWGPDIIDINMGCSTRRVSGRGAGVGMMRQPSVVAETFALLARHLSVPVTAKIRLGWEDGRNYLEIGRILEDNGAALIAIHPRTKEQKYGGAADWSAIAALKEAVDVPVVGNGDITEPEHIDQMLAATGCDAVMVGRGAIGNPWIFAGRRRADLTFTEIAATARLHMREMLAYHGAKHGLLRFRKHLRRYLEGYSLLEDLLAQMMTAPTEPAVLALLAESEARISAAANVVVPGQAAGAERGTRRP
jgi:nifR3 family TIM-barrel protein